MDLKPLTTKDPRLNNLNQNIDTGDHNNLSHHNGTAQWGSRTVRMVQPVNYFGGPNPTLTLHELPQASARLLSSSSVLPTASYSTLENNELCYKIECYEKITRVLETRKHYNTLYSAEVISMQDMEEVQAEVKAFGRGRGAELLLNKVQKYFSAANPNRRLEIISKLRDSFQQHRQQHLIKYLNSSYLTSAVQPTQPTVVATLKKKPNINQRIAETGANLPVNTGRPCQIDERSFDDKHSIKTLNITKLSLSEENTTQHNRSDAQRRACEHEEISSNFSKPGTEEKYPVQETNYDSFSTSKPYR